MTRCWLSENHVAISTIGDVVPCTRYRKRELSPNINDISLQQAFDSVYLNNIRLSLQSGIKLPGCNKCWKQEETGICSMRQEYTGAWLGKLQSLEIAFSNHCNYACRHCNSFSSSKWIDDDISLGNPYPKKKLSEPDLSNIDISILENLTYIKILGGEPLINKNHEKFLTQLTNIENITLEYTTNGSVFPNSKILDIWSKAKSIKLSVSMDDIFEGFDYFRTGGNFNNVIENCKKYNELDIVCRFHIVINVLNFKRLPIIIEYLEKNFPRWLLFFDKVVNPQWLTISQFSKSYADDVLCKISNNNVRSIIENECINEYTDLSLFFKINTALDIRRKTKLLDVHPYFKNLII